MRVGCAVCQVFEFRYSSLNAELLTACAKDKVALACGVAAAGDSVSPHHQQQANKLSTYTCLKDRVTDVPTEACRGEIQRVMEKQVQNAVSTPAMMRPWPPVNDNTPPQRVSVPVGLSAAVGWLNGVDR